jgi:tetratricopeptide (TPR) repeat protein
MVRIAPLVAIAIWIACITAPASAEDHKRMILGSDPNLSDGATALSTGNYDEGVRLTKLGLKAPPERGDRSAAMSNLCAGLAGTQKYDQALAHCRAALEIDDRNWQAYNNRALVYFRLGDLAAAQRDIDRGLALNPESGQLKRVQKLVDEAPNRK